jgi:predicted alpha/beta-hydrolase family hydrolase
VSRPARRAGLGVLLAPGAGADRDQATLVALDEQLSAAGAVVERMDFPYRRAGRRAPDRPPVLLAAVEEEAGRLADRLKPSSRAVIAGGRSMGGRMCSMAVAEGRVPEAAGLLLISYPLHPPGRPDKLRTEHFPRIIVPCLFVSGRRDAFAAPDELEAATAAIKGPVTHQWVDGKDHALRGVDGLIGELALDWLRGLGLLPAGRARAVGAVRPARAVRPVQP